MSAVPGIRRQPASVCGILLLLLVVPPRPGRAQPSGGPYGPIPQTYPLPDKAAHVYYVAPDGKAEAAGTTLAEPTTLEAAIERVVTGDAIVMRGGTYRTGGLRLNQGITLQPYARRAAGPQGDAGRDEVAGPAQQRVADVLDDAVPGPAAWAGGSATARACGRRSTGSTTTWSSSTARCCSRPAGKGELDEHSYYIDYEAGQVYIGMDPDEPAGRDHRLRQRPRAHERPLPRQGVGQEGPDHPRDHVHAVRLPRARHRGEEARDPRVRGADRRARGPGRSRDLRQGGRGHDARERDHLLLLARGRLLPRGRAHAPELPHQRHQHRGLLRHRLLRRAAGAEHLPAEQRRAAHRLLPGRGQDLQPVPPRHRAATTW